MTKANELLDIYDATGRHIGTKERGLVHRDGDWHRTFHCWVIYRDGDGRERVVLQRRSDNKKSWPGYVDITAAGHYEAGESTADGLREVEEEIGISPTPDSLISLGTRVCVEEYGGVPNHEFQDVFFLIDDRKLDGYRLQGDELSGLLVANVDDLLALFRKTTDAVTGDGLQLVLENGAKVPRPASFTITRESFIPSLDNYNYKVMVLAKRALRGDADLLI